ncbi:unnamed protein product [Aphanomyces euteiches]|nr:hypothetical protein AeRB84_001732 [Aphanomyces euteiches]
MAKARTSGGYDKQSEDEAREWIEAITKRSIGDDFGQGLKNGVILCELANALDGSLKLKPSTSNMPFKQMENVSAFLRACRSLGVAEFDLFETVDLFELKDIGIVVRCLHALGRAMQKKPGYSGPTLGVKEATKNARQFTEAQIAEARAATSLLNMGSIGTMQRTSIDSSTSVTFGADAAKTPAATPVVASETASDVPSIFRRGSSNSNLSTPAPTPTPAPEPVKTSGNVSIPPAFQRKNSNSPPKPAPVQTRGGGFGLDAELAAKAIAKYDYALEASCQAWIEAVTHSSFENGFGETLRDGQVLCLLINTLQASSQVPVNPIKIESSTNNFKLMQNIKHFLAACRSLGVADVDCFETVDLFELKDLGLVVRCIHALSRTIGKKFPKYTGPLVDRLEGSPEPVQKVVAPAPTPAAAVQPPAKVDTTPEAVESEVDSTPVPSVVKKTWPPAKEVDSTSQDEIKPPAVQSSFVQKSEPVVPAAATPPKAVEEPAPKQTKPAWPPVRTTDTEASTSSSRPQLPSSLFENTVEDVKPSEEPTPTVAPPAKNPPVHRAPAPMARVYWPGARKETDGTVPSAAFRAGGALPTRTNWT